MDNTKPYLITADRPRSLDPVVGPEVVGEPTKKHDATVTYTIALGSPQTSDVAAVVQDGVMRATSLGLTKPGDVAISVLVLLEERGFTVIRKPRGNGRK